METVPETAGAPAIRYVDLRRHTDSDGDRLSPEGVAAAEELGRSELHAPYAPFVTSGAGRATQMREILRSAAGQRDAPILVEKETQLLGAALRRVVQHVPDGGRALVIGHSPTTEAAVMGISGTTCRPSITYLRRRRLTAAGARGRSCGPFASSECESGRPAGGPWPISR